MQPLVLSLIGADRTGLVEALSAAVAAHGGSWERSHVTELAGTFAGVVLVHVPEDRVEAFRAALLRLREDDLLEVTVRPATVDGEPPADAPSTVVEVVGTDRPGIVHEVSHLLAGLGIGIVELRTSTESAAMAGTPLFRATAEVRLPDGVDGAALTAALESLSDDLMVDLPPS